MCEEQADIVDRVSALVVPVADTRLVELVSDPYRWRVTIERVRAALDALDGALAQIKRRPKRRSGATATAIARLEAAWQRSLPPTYRAFLELRDGFADKASDPEVVGLLSTSALTTTSALTRESDEWKRADPDCAEAVRGLIIGRTLDRWTLLDPGAPRGSELAVVTINSEYEVTEAADLAEYLIEGAATARDLQRSMEFIRDTNKRADELAQQGAQIIGVRTSAVSPDGRVLAVLSTASINLFDLAHPIERDRSRYAPCIRWIEPIGLADADHLSFSRDDATVICSGPSGAEAYDVATGAPRLVPAHRECGTPIKVSNRFNRRDGIRLT